LNAILRDKNRIIVFLIILFLFMFCDKENLPETGKALKPSKFPNQDESGAPITLMPSVVKFDKSKEKLYVIDSKKCKVISFSPEGKFLGEFGGEGEGPGNFLYPTDIGFDEAGRIYVVDLDIRKVKIFASPGNEIRSFVSKGNPWKFVVRDTNEIYILTPLPVDDKILLRYNWHGEIIDKKVETHKEEHPIKKIMLNEATIAEDNSGNLYIAYRNEYRIVRIDKKGDIDNQYITQKVPYEIIKPHKRINSDEDRLMSYVIADISTDENENLYVLWGENMGKLFYWVDKYNKKGEIKERFKLNIESTDVTFFSMSVLSGSIYVAEAKSEGVIYRYNIKDDKFISTSYNIISR